VLGLGLQPQGRPGNHARRITTEVTTMRVKLFTAKERRALHANFRWNLAKRDAGEDCTDFQPVVKLFLPWHSATWLLTELDPEDNDQAFGLCDLGMGSPELGYVSIAELQSVSGPGGLTIERDRHARLVHRLSEYADQARAAGRITV
jgi:hypothetical protein